LGWDFAQLIQNMPFGNMEVAGRRLGLEKTEGLKQRAASPICLSDGSANYNVLRLHEGMSKQAANGFARESFAPMLRRKPIE
jgi:hypothetical protein